MVLMTSSELHNAINHLSSQFARVTRSYGPRAPRGSELYNHQVEFAYMIDEIDRGPRYNAPKIISQCETMIDRIAASMRNK